MPQFIPAAASVAGSLIGADSARSAANKQADAANNATALQKSIFDTINQQQAGARQRGDAAGNMLALYQGLPQETSSPIGSTPMGTTPQYTSYNAVRDQLLPQFTTNVNTGEGYSTVIDEPALQAAIQQRLQQQTQPTPQAAQPAYSNSDPRFGSLFKPFTGADLPNEPGYQFGLDQGIKALDRSAAARGRLASGAQTNALTRYGTDYASTKYGDAFNRDMAQKQFINNALAGVAGTGQIANQQTASSAMNYGNQAGQNMIGAGNARGAASIGAGNALSSGLNGLAYYYGPHSYGSQVTNGDLMSANMSSDPLGALGSAKGWWSN